MANGFHPDDLPPLMGWRELLTSGESGEIEARLVATTECIGVLDTSRTVCDETGNSCAGTEQVRH